MFSKKKLRKPKYFKGRISKGFISLYSSRMIFRIAGGLMGLFMPIFLYQLFEFDFRYVIYYYMFRYGIYALVVGWGAKYLNKIGLRRSIRFSIVWIILFYITLFYLDHIMRATDLAFFEYKWKILLFTGLALLFMTLRNMMYWVPVHTDMAKFTNRRNRAKQLSLLEATTVASQALLPLIAGLILSFYNYGVLFLCVIFICLASSIPLVTLPKTRERFRWSYLQTWKEFFSRKRRKTVVAYMGDGAENVIGIIVWPIFMWEILNGDYLQLGLLSSLVITVTVLMQLGLGKMVDLKDKNKILKFGTFFYSIGWIIKMFVATAFHIFVVSAYHNITKMLTRTPFDAMTYEKAADQGHFVDEFTVIHEMAVNLGRFLMLIVVFVLISWVSLEWTFILGALAALTLNFLTPDSIIEEGRTAG
jgi:hypothetical protein